MNKTLDEWIALYNKKNYEEFKRDEKFGLFYLPEKGFAEIVDSGKMIIVNQMCGEFKFWRDVAEKLSRHRGYKVAGTICIRPILAYIRLAGFKIDRIEETNLGDRYFCTDKRTGQKGQASPAGKDTWFITWEVTADDTG